MENIKTKPSLQNEAQERRWRLILGKGEEGGQNEDGNGDQSEPDGEPGNDSPQLSEEDQQLDEALEALYGDEGGLGDSMPDVARWLGDIRRYFSQPVAQMVQQDALRKLKIRKILDEPELLAEIEPDIELVTKLISLSKQLPTQTRESARQVVQQVVDDIRAKLEYPLLQALTGSLNRALRQQRPRNINEINWLHTIQANLKHYQPEQRTVIPEKLIGYGKQRSSLKDVILCIDQSGSMAKSVVYASVFGAVMASLPSLTTHLVVFDTKVVDLTDELQDPVDLLFGLQLRGGTNINRALGYCQQLVTRPQDTIMVLITDLYEGGSRDDMIRRVETLVADGVQVIVLLSLNDEGAPRFNRQIAQSLVDLGVPSFACTPDLFPDLMAAAINGQDIQQWAAINDVVTAPSN
ncbi:MAG: VWA domain-containing protein [Chloroflexota bacterium]